MLRPSFIAHSLLPLLFASLVALPTFASSAAAAPQGAPHAAPPPASNPLLPATFAGWQIAGTPQESTSPSVADNSAAAALREYGFVRYEAARYTRDQDSLTVRAMEFGDATGAYGTFTLYRRPNMVPEPIGEGAAFDGSRVLFWNGTVLVDAKFSRITPMSVAELRDLVTQLPQPTGNQDIKPSLPGYLPSEHLKPMTVQYAIGPAAYQMQGGILPSLLVDFGRSAEVVTAQYNSLDGTGSLTVINYPTSDIAIDREHAMQRFFRSHGSARNPWTQALADSNPAAIQSRRSGPLVAVTSGGFSAGAAQQLLQRVHYEVDLTMAHRARYVPDTAKVAQIIIGVAILVGIFAVIAIVAAVSLGGGRVLWRRMRAKQGFPSDGSEEFIRLNLKE